MAKQEVVEERGKGKDRCILRIPEDSQTFHPISDPTKGPLHPSPFSTSGEHVAQQLVRQSHKQVNEIISCL